MAVTSIEVIQSNIVGNINVVAIHSPVIFVYSCTYTGDAPDYLLCDVVIDEVVTATFRTVYEYDTAEARIFSIDISEAIKGYMPDLDDTPAASSTIAKANNSKVFSIICKDISESIISNITIEACQSNRQFGDDVCMTDVCVNEDEIFYGAAGLPCYVYFYNLEAGTVPTNTSYALDYNDDIFTDYNGDRFIITDEI